MRLAHVPALITLLGLWSVSWERSAAQEDPLRERFLTEAPTGWQRIEGWESELECEGTLKKNILTRPGSAQEVRSPNEGKVLRLRQKKDRFVLQVTYADGYARVTGVNPHYSFILKSSDKPSSGGPNWRVTALEDTAPPAEHSPLAGQVQRDTSVRRMVMNDFELYMFPATKYGVIGQWKDMLTQKGFSLAKVEPFQSEGNQLVKIYCVWHFKDSEGKDYTDDVTLVFDPTNNWALTESLAQGSDASVHRKVFYRSEAVAGIRPPERVVQVATGPGGKRTEEFVFTKYDRVNLPDDAFTLSAFGLPEPGGVTRSQATPWYLWLSLGGGLCLVLAGVFYWLKKRAAMTAQTP